MAKPKATKTQTAPVGGEAETETETETVEPEVFEKLMVTIPQDLKYRLDIGILQERRKTKDRSLTKSSLVSTLLDEWLTEGGY